MKTIKRRPYLGETDRKAIADFLNAYEAHSQLEQDQSVSQIHREIDAPGVDKTQNLRLWEDEDGKLMGFGYLYMLNPSPVIDAYLSLCVERPEIGENDFSAHDLARDIINWGEERLREVGKKVDLPVNLRFCVHEDRKDRISLLTERGFKVDRYYLTMKRSLNLDIPLPQFPAGFRLSHRTKKGDLQAWVELFNESFIDHWNHHDLNIATLKHWLNDPNYNPELDLIAIAPNGKFAAFCYCNINPIENLRYGHNEGWIEWLGTQRNFRKLGLGKAMLLAGLHCLKKAGVATAKLSVDADSLTGATRLYESVGFRPVETWVDYVKAI